MFTSVLGPNCCVYRYQLSETEIRCLDKIGISDIGKNVMSDIPRFFSVSQNKHKVEAGIYGLERHRVTKLTVLKE